MVPKNNNEFRIWPQIILSQKIGAFSVEQRYRAELRYTSNGYRNRYRYRLGLSYPFGKDNNGFKPFQVSFSNELFFTNNEPYFERNRLLLALNYKPTKATTLQVGIAVLPLTETIPFAMKQEYPAKILTKIMRILSITPLLPPL